MRAKEWRQHLKRLKASRSGKPPPLYVPTILACLNFFSSDASVRNKSHVGARNKVRKRLVHPWVPPLWLEYGVYNTWFLRAFAELSMTPGWVIETYGNHNWAREFVEETVDKAYFDEEMYSAYASMRIVKNDFPQTIFLAKELGADDCTDFETTQNGRTVVVLPRSPGYWKVQIAPPTNGIDTRTEWISTLSSAKFSYRFDPRQQVLYFSNTLGSKLGLPPAPAHIGVGLVSTFPHATPELYGCSCGTGYDQGLRRLFVIGEDIQALPVRSAETEA
jgi:hypothetical protein